MVKETKARITYVELLKEDLVIIRLTPVTGMPKYRTGQFLTIGVPIPREKKIVRRAYSIASHPENRDYYEFVIRWVRKPLPGRVTTELFYSSVGDMVDIGDPTGAALQISQALPRRLSRHQKDNLCWRRYRTGTVYRLCKAPARHQRQKRDHRAARRKLCRRAQLQALPD